MKNGITADNHSYDNVPVPLLDRGYTLHEHMPVFGLMHMNGRLYDPQVGRMLSTDNNVQDPANGQNYNRYTYVLNNPLKYNDPTGEVYQGYTGGAYTGPVNGGINTNFSQAQYLNGEFIGFGDGTSIWGEESGPGIGGGGAGGIGDVSSSIAAINAMNRNGTTHSYWGSKASYNRAGFKNINSQNRFQRNESSIALANYLSSTLFIPSPIISTINPLYGAAAATFDIGINLVSGEFDAGILLMLQGKYAGKYVYYGEIAGGFGTGGSGAIETTRIDYTGGNDKVRMEMLKGERDKIYFGGSFLGHAGIGVALSEFNGDYLIGTSISLGLGGAPFGVDIGYNNGEIIFKNE
jgi:RHS repeat-associated protein